MEDKNSYYKVVIQSADFKEEKPEHYVFISRSLDNNIEDLSILISLQFAASKEEILQLLSDKPETIMENGHYYSDINWFIKNSENQSERQTIFNKLKEDIKNFIKETVPPTTA